jgi:hypothetical protein
MGKSLVALDIAARVSRGAPWPDDGSRNEDRGASNARDLDPRSSPLAPSSVLLLNIEDHFATTIRPRLEALGADCSRIPGLSYVPGEGVFTIPRPLAINRDVTMNANSRSRGCAESSNPVNRL